MGQSQALPMDTKGAAKMAFTDSEIAEAHAAVRVGGDCDKHDKLGLSY